MVVVRGGGSVILERDGFQVGFGVLFDGGCGGVGDVVSSAHFAKWVTYLTSRNLYCSEFIDAKEHGGIISTPEHLSYLFGDGWNG